jgi:hypothetical protein
MTSIAIAASLAACGGGGEQSTSSTSAQQAEQAQVQAEADAKVKAHNAEVQREHRERKAAEAPSAEEQQAKETASDFYAILASDEAKKNPNRTTIDSASFCELMSEEAQAQTIHYAKVSSGVQQEWDCESAVELLVLRSKRAGGAGFAGVEVIGVNALGETATATVRVGDGPATALALVKEDGEWKLAAASPVAGGQ